MSDYISKSEAIEWLKDVKEAGCVDKYSDAIRRDHFDEAIETIESMPTVEAVPIDWIDEWCLSQDLEYVRIAIKKMMDNWKAERKEE